MRLVELLQVAGAVLGALASIFAVVEQRVVMRFHQAEATSPATALDPPALGPLPRWRLARLVAAGAVVRVGPRRLYLDETAYAAVRRRRAVQGVVLVVAVLATVVLAHRLLGWSAP